MSNITPINQLANLAKREPRLPEPDDWLGYVHAVMSSPAIIND